MVRFQSPELSISANFSPNIYLSIAEFQTRFLRKIGKKKSRKFRGGKNKKLGIFGGSQNWGDHNFAKREDAISFAGAGAP